MSKLLHAVNPSRRNRALLLSSAAVCVLASSPFGRTIDVTLRATF